MSPYDTLRLRHGPAYKWLATTTAMIGTFSVVIEAAILNVAVPEIMTVYGVGQQTAQWLITAFLAAMTTGMLLNAWCIERFGVRATYVGAILVFGAASLLGACGPAIGWLIVARATQGVAAGVVQPLGLIVVFKVFDLNERGKGIGLYGLGVVLGPAIAPMIGGLVVDFIAWQAAFVVSLPIALLALVMALLYLPAERGTVPPRLDVPGLALLTMTLVVLMWALDAGPRTGWGRPAVWIGLLATAAGGVAFVLRQRVCLRPLLDLDTFRSPGFAAGFMLSMMIGIGLYASTFLVPLYLQQVQRLDPSAAGLVMLPGGLAMALVFPVAGPMTDRLPPPLVTLFGILLCLLSCLMLAQVGVATGIVLITLAVVVGRAGLGLMMPPVNAGSLRLLTPTLVPQGSGVISFGRQLGGAVGVSLISIVLDIGAGTADATFATLTALERQVALADGYRLSFAILALAFTVAMVPLLFLHRAYRRL